MKRPGVDGNKLYAFWRHGTFPYVLGGTIKTMAANGVVECHEYGGGRRFMPIKILPAEAGRKLLLKLKALEIEHRKAQEAFDVEWEERLKALLPEAIQRQMKG
jgi:hypothetical protein